MPDQLWSAWWAWMAFGFALGILEVLVPGFVFLGFAIGAVVTGIILLAGLITSLPLLLFVFALVSLASWLVLRKVVGVRQGQVKMWHSDINDNG